jgi:hypothetical protein
MPIQTVRETLHLLGYLNARYGQPERAVGYFELMTVIDGMNPSAWRSLATIQLSLDKNPEAISSADKALELGIPPDEVPLCHLVKAIANRRLGNIPDGEISAAAFLQSRQQQGGGI